MVRGITVTDSDLKEFRNLLRLFLNVTLENTTRKEKDHGALYKKIQASVDDYLYLDEPFLATEAMLAVNGQNQGVVLISDDHYGWYSQYASITIPNLPTENGFEELSDEFLSTSEANNVLSVARAAQVKLKRALAGAETYEEEESPGTVKGFVN